MIYINKNTGEVRDFTCAIISNIWTPCEKASVTDKDKTEKPARKAKTKAV